MIYAKRRTNVMSAKHIPLSEKIYEKGMYMTSNWKHKRRVIQDLCDYCLKPTYFNRDIFEALKKKGYKGICYKCLKELKLDYKKDNIIIASNYDNLKRGYEISKKM